MKNIWKILTGLMLIASTAYLTSCVKGDFDEPPIYIPTVNFEANTTIAELKASYTGLRLIDEDIIIKGIVIANDESGNLYKKLSIQDETAGIELALDKTNLYNEFKVGQRVFIKCRGMYIGDYNNLIQLGYLFNNNIGRLPEVFISNHIFRDSLAGPVPEPVVVSPNSLNTQLISQLVTFENIRFVEPGTEWAPQTAEATNRTIAGSSTVVRTSRYSNFASAPVPEGYGDVTGVLSIFGSTYQLTIRNLNDVGEFGGEVPPPPPGSGDGSKNNPYSVAQAIQMQNANPYVVGFVKGYIIGSVKSGVTSVGSAGDIDFSAPFTSNTNVLIADDQNETNYLNAVIVNLPAGSSLRATVNLQTNPENVGKWLNVKGTLRTYFGVAGLRDFSGEAGDFEFEGGGGGGGGGGTGSGTQSDPYDVATAIEKQNANPYVVGWVKGFIVGSVKSGVTSIGSSDDIHFTPPFTSATNVLLADNANETNYLNCVIVNLPAGKPLRSQVNLMDNPDNLGKWLNVTGTLRTYFGVAGLRDSNGELADFELQSGGGGGGTSIFLEDFVSSLGSFSAYSVTGEQQWGWATFDGGCAVMSGYANEVNYANEDWLISPSISLASQTGVTMNFREAINYITQISDMKVLISTNYPGSGNPNSSDWTELTGFSRAPGNNWTFINSGDVSLAAYEGQSIRIAFKYLSTTAGAATWEISRVEVK